MTTYRQEFKNIQMSLMDLRARRLVCKAMKLGGADHRIGR